MSAQCSQQRVLKLAQVEVRPQVVRGEISDGSVEDIRQSIRVHRRLYSPPVVEPTDDPEAFRLVTGHRRFRALQLEGFEESPFIVLPEPLGDVEKIEAAHIENCVRLDVNIWDRGLTYRHLIDNCGYTRERITVRLGVSAPLISRALKVVDRLSPELEDAVKQKQLTADEAYQIAAKIKSPGDQRTAAEEVMRGRKVDDVLKLRRKIKAARRAKPVALDAGEFKLSLVAYPEGYGPRDLAAALQTAAKRLLSSEARP